MKNCKCVCHSKNPLEHETECCENMHGSLENKDNRPWWEINEQKTRFTASEKD